MEPFKKSTLLLLALVIALVSLAQNVFAVDESGYWAFDTVTRDQGGRNDVSTEWKDVSDTAVAGMTTWKWDPSPNACRQTIVSAFSWSGVPEILVPDKPFNLTAKLEQINNNNCASVGSWIKLYMGVTSSTTSADGPSVGFGTGDGLVGEQTSELYGPRYNPGDKCYILVHCMMYQEWYEVKYWYKWVEGGVQSGNDETGHPDGGASGKFPQLGDRIRVNEIGQYFGEWTRIEGTDTFNAIWNGQITDVIEVQSIEGNQITLYRQGNGGYYYGTLNGDGTITGTASWYEPNWTWSGTIEYA